jgi:phage/plasmid-like protein (TIGR03299 family)
MAHNLNYDKKNNRHAFFSAKEKAWHSLGKVTEGALTSEEAIKEALLDWKVIQEPVTFGKKHIVVPGKFVNVRQDTGVPLGIVGANYEVVQNKDAFTFFDSIVGKKEALFETAGALFEGQRIFISAKLPDYIKVAKDDLIEKYLFLTTSHDGSGSIIGAFTPVRVVCNNTLNAALTGLKNSTGPIVRLRHTTSVKERLEEAHKLMGITNQLATEMQEIFITMSKKKIVEKQLTHLIVATLKSKEYLNKIWIGDPKDVSTRMKNQVTEIVTYAKTNESQQMASTDGTVFGAYNAITGYFQNVKDFKDPKEKLSSILDGGAFRTGQRAFDLCLEFIK